MWHKKMISDDKGKELLDWSASGGALVTDTKAGVKKLDLKEIQEEKERTQIFEELMKHIRTSPHPVGIKEKDLLASVFHTHAPLDEVVIVRGGKTRKVCLDDVFRWDLKELFEEYVFSADKERFFKSHGVTGVYRYYFEFLFVHHMSDICRYPAEQNVVRLIFCEDERKANALKKLGVRSEEAKSLEEMWPQEEADDPLALSVGDAVKLVSVLELGLQKNPKSGYTEKEVFSTKGLDLDASAPAKISQQIMKDLKRAESISRLYPDDFDKYLRGRYMGGQVRTMYQCVRQFAKDIGTTERSVLFYRHMLQENGQKLLRYQNGTQIYLLPNDADMAASGIFDAVSAEVRQWLKDGMQRTSDRHKQIGDRLLEEQKKKMRVAAVIREEGSGDRKDGSSKDGPVHRPSEKKPEPTYAPLASLDDLLAEVDKKFAVRHDGRDGAQHDVQERTEALRYLASIDDDRNTMDTYGRIFDACNGDIDAAVQALQKKWIEEQERTFRLGPHFLTWDMDLGKYGIEDISNQDAKEVLEFLLRTYPSLSARTGLSAWDNLNELIARNDLFSLLGITEEHVMHDRLAAELYGYVRGRLEKDEQDRFPARWEQYELARLRQLNRWAIEHHVYPSLFKRSRHVLYQIQKDSLMVLKDAAHDIQEATRILENERRANKMRGTKGYSSYRVHNTYPADSTIDPSPVH